MSDVTQADRDRRNAIYKELTGFAVIEPVASQYDWMDKYLAEHRTAGNLCRNSNIGVTRGRHWWKAGL
ncbi:MAG: hypothetical protein KA199_08560 [Sphingorhabdus sp.]|nr:hypothetical protein [Sphingorhabdus sp.]